jgi:hypothetical protein
MRRVFASVSLCLVGCSATPHEEPSVVSEPLAGPVAAYAFDEGAGATTADRSGNNFTGALTATTWTTAGKFGNALSFNGSSSWITVADAPALHLTTGMTVEAWVNPGASMSGTWREVLYKEGAGTFAYALYANTSSNHPDIGYSTSSGAEKHEQIGAALPVNTWTHVAGTFDGAALRLYRNGTLAGTLKTTAAIGATTGALRIGGSAIEGEFFNGRIDEVRIYARALSASEIMVDMNSPIGSAQDGGAQTGPDGASDATASSEAQSDGASDARPESSPDSNDAQAADAAAESAPDSAADATSNEAPDPGEREASVADASGDSTEGGVTADAGSEASSGGSEAAPPPDAGAATTYPLRKVPGAHYLVDQAGNPFFIHGDAAWSFISNLTIEDANVYLDDRASRGVNTIIVNLIEHLFSQNAPANLYGEQPFTTPGDFSTPNEAYFARADAFLRAAAAHGIQVLLFPAYLGNNGGGEGWYQEEIANGTGKMSAYGAYLGNRYRSFDNIFWVLGGDYSPPPEGVAIVDAVANGIKSADSRHLMTAHGSSWTDSAIDNYAGKPWLDTDAVYTGTVASVILANYQRSDWLPTFLFEASYEGEGATSADLRKQAYEAVLNGGSGQVYGNAPMWCFGSNCFFGGYTPNWQPSLGTVGAQDQQRVLSFFTARSWWKLVPDTGHVFLTAGFDGTSTARAPDGSWASAYLPSSHGVTVGLGSFGHSVTGKWYNPATGSYATIAGSPFAPSGTLNVTPPASGDWVLLFE